MGIDSVAVPVKACGWKVSPIPLIAPPPLGSDGRVVSINDSTRLLSKRYLLRNSRTESIIAADEHFIKQIRQIDLQSLTDTQ